MGSKATQAQAVRDRARDARLKAARERRLQPQARLVEEGERPGFDALARRCVGLCFGMLEYGVRHEARSRVTINSVLIAHPAAQPRRINLPAEQSNAMDLPRNLCRQLGEQTIRFHRAQPLR